MLTGTVLCVELTTSYLRGEPLIVVSQLLSLEPRYEVSVSAFGITSIHPFRQSGY